MIRLFLSALFLLALSACSSTKKPLYDDRPLATIYQEAETARAEKKDLEKAAQLYENVERQYPYSNEATESLLKAAQTYHSIRQYDNAIDILERFIRLHPAHKNIDEAVYLKALSYFEQIMPADRDQSMTHKAERALKEVLTRFPNTSKSEDAKLKLDFVYDRLAEQHMIIGRYSMWQKNYIAAHNRFRKVTENFQTTVHTPEALHRLTECYVALGRSDDAKTTARYLSYNFPQSKWYKYTYRLLKQHGLVEQA